MGQRYDGDEDATLSRGGGVMMRAARPVYKGTAPRITSHYHQYRYLKTVPVIYSEEKGENINED